MGLGAMRLTGDAPRERAIAVLRRAVIAPVVCVQNRFALGAPAGERELLRACGELGIAYVPFFAITSAGDSTAVDAIARAHGATPAQVRLAWTLQLGRHVLAIPGTGNPAHLDDNVAAAALTLSPAEMSLLG